MARQEPAPPEADIRTPANVPGRLVHLTLKLLPLLPAALLAALMAGPGGGRIGGYAAFALALLAPGWLVWKVLPNRVFDWNEPLALPAVWLVLSFTVLSPAVAGLVFFGWNVWVVEWYLLVALLALGIAAWRFGHRRIGPWDKATLAVGAVGLAAFLYRTSIWRVGTDDKTYVGYLRAFAATGTYPTTNPFMSGDLPLAPRWRLDAWTGLTGVLAHLGNLDPEVFFREILPGLMVIIGASALFVLVRVLSASRGSAQVAAVAALTVPLLLGLFKYRSIGYNKFTALFVFLPVAAALFILVYRGGRRSTAAVAAAVFWGAMFVHPVPAMWVAALLAGFVAVDSLLTRKVTWQPIGLVGAAMVPMILTALIVSSTGDKFGVRLGDVENLSEIAAPSFDIGPITVWEPLEEVDIMAYGPESAAAVFVRGHVNGPVGPRLVFVGKRLPLAHWNVLWAPGNILVGLALLIIVYGRHRDDTAIWVVAATLVSLSVFIIPPLAAFIGRFITPWQLWRFSWLMPAAVATAWLVGVWLPRTRWKVAGGAVILLTIALVFGLASPRFRFKTEPSRSYLESRAEIAELEPYAGVFLAPSPLRQEASSQLESFETLTYSSFTHMSNGFPSSRRPEAFDRLQDFRVFFNRESATTERLAILDQHEVDYVIVERATRSRFDFDALGLERVERIGEDYVLFARVQAAGQ